MHANFKLPNNNTRVDYLLDAIECDDAALLTVIDKVEEDDLPPGKCNSFEICATHLLSKDPIVKKRLIHTKRTSGQISGIYGGAEARDDISATGIHFRYYKPENVGELTQAQCEELRSHCASHGNGKGCEGVGGGG